MAYVATGLSDTQAKKMRDSLEVEKLRAMPQSEKIDILLRHQSIRADRRRAFWEAVASGITLLAFLGLAGRK